MKYKEFLLTNKKYVLILLVGVILLVAGNIKLPKAKDTKEDTYLNPIDEKKLEKILEKIEGAGEVNVFITYKNNGKKQIAKEVSTSEENIDSKPEPINDEFYILSLDAPEITGVLITSSGAKDKDVKDRILRGAKHALGVPYHLIAVEQGE